MIWTVRLLLAFSLTFLELLFPSIVLGDATSLELRLDDGSLQTIRAWGLTPAPLDWPGNSELQSPEIAHQLFSESGATMVRLLVSPGIYNDAEHGLDLTQADLILAPELESVVGNGISRYVISIVGPPKGMKKYFSEEGSVQFDPNGLRNDAEDAFCRNIADLMHYIAVRRFPLPEAISFATLPDLDETCPYSPEQWWRLALKLRGLLDHSGLGTVALIGPDAYSPRGLLEFWRAAPQGSTTLSGWATSFGARSAVRAEDALAAAGIFAGAERIGKGIWMLATHPVPVSGPNGLLLSVLGRMGNDLLLFHADYWFWDYGYTPESRVDSLFWGTDGHISPVYGALRQLWQLAPPGAEVRRLHGIEPTAGAMPEGFALSYGSRLTVVLLNASADAKIYFPDGLHLRDLTVNVYLDAAEPSAVLPRRTHGRVFFEIPPAAVAIVSGTAD